MTYDQKIKNDHDERLAFIRAHHGFLLEEHLKCHLIVQLRKSSFSRNVVTAKRQTNLLELFKQSSQKSNVLVSNINDGPSSQRNDTGTDMKPVATLTQEHPIVISQAITVYCGIIIPLCKINPPQASPQRGLTPLPTPHMCPGGMQDESSKHVHDEKAERCSSKSSRAMYQRMWRARRMSHRAPSQNKKAVKQRRWRAGLLSNTRREQLERLLFTIYKDTAWMKDVLRRAYNSKYVDDSFVTDCASLCDTLVDGCAGQIADYNLKDKEVDTVALKQRTMAKLTEARTRFKFLQKVIAL